MELQNALSLVNTPISQEVQTQMNTQHEEQSNQLSDYVQSLNLPAAITQTGQHPRLTDRYVPIRTSEVIDVMKTQGFEVNSYKVDKCSRDLQEFARHAVIFRHPDIVFGSEVVPQMLWMNSHNGKTPGIMRFGMYKFACANGLVIGTDIASIRIRHMGPLATQLIQRIDEFMQEQPKMIQTIDEWRALEMQSHQAIDFATQALALRFGETLAGQYNVEEVLRARRVEDDNGSLWATFNRVQEATTKGGLTGANANGRRVSSRELKAIGQDTDYNSQLWNLAGTFAVKVKSFVPENYTVSALVETVDDDDSVIDVQANEVN